MTNDSYYELDYYYRNRDSVLARCAVRYATDYTLRAKIQEYNRHYYNNKKAEAKRKNELKIKFNALEDLSVSRGSFRIDL